MNSTLIVAIHAMVFLHHKGVTVSSEALAENICTHPARVRQVMAKLKKAGLVEACEGGFKGGYAYQKTKQVTLGQIAQALDAKFAETSWRSGDAEMDCQVASGMAGYIDGLYAEINKRCREYLDTITVADVERTLFHGGDRQDAGAAPSTIGAGEGAGG